MTKVFLKKLKTLSLPLEAYNTPRKLDQKIVANKIE